MIGTALGIALFAWSYGTFCTSVYGASRAAWQRRRARRGEGARALVDRGVHILVVRPCAGLDPELERSLGSLAEAKTRGRVTCRLAVESDEDPAAIPARRAAAALREQGIAAEVVLTSADAPNHKAAQIEAVLDREGEPWDVLVVADSDVDLRGFDLDALVAPVLADPRAGAVWAPPVEVGAIAGSGDRASQALLSGSLHAFTLLGALDGGGLVGKLFAAPASAVAAAGGFGAMDRVLGEDMELGRRLRDAGRSVAVAQVVARSVQAGRTWRAVVERYARWLTVIRAQRPHLLASYPLLFVATPLVIALSIALAPFAPELALGSAIAALAGRSIAAVAARRLAGQPFAPLRSIADAGLADALLAAAFVRALATRTFTWRGRTLTVDRRGQLSERAA